jgi:rhomboid protease GluP
VSETVEIKGEDVQQHPPPRRKPSPGQLIRLFPATFGLIGFTTAVFLLQLLSTTFFDADLVLYFGAKDNQAIAAGEYWRLVSPILIHAGFAHFFVNMYSLYAIGPAIERFYDKARFLVIYILSGISGVVLSFALSPSRSIGASGAIFGLLGALGGFVAVLNLALGTLPGIDNWGHIGGLIAGIGLSWLIGPRYAPIWDTGMAPKLVDQRPWKKFWPLAIAWVAFIGAATALLLLW